MNNKTYSFHKREYLGSQLRRSLPQSFCFAPFSQLFLYPDGNVFPCCEGGPCLGNIKTQTLEEIWNGEIIKKIRSEFLAGNPLICKQFIKEKNCFRSCDSSLPYADLKIHQDQPPRVLDLVQHGDCPLDCIMCEVKNVKEQLLNGGESEARLFNEVFSRAKLISLKSGEPFLHPETFRLMEGVHKKNLDCHFRVTTNGQFKADKTFFDKIAPYTFEEITFSIDSLNPDHFRKIRKGGELATALQCLDAFLNWNKEATQADFFKISINCTVQKENWKDLPGLLKFFQKKDIPVSLLFVSHPKAHSLLDLDIDEKNRLLKFFIELDESYDFVFSKIFQCLSPLFETENTVTKKLKQLFFQRVLSSQKEKASHCPLPHTQLTLHPSGKFQPCCWLSDYILGEAETSTIQKAWMSKALQRLREDPKECLGPIEKYSCQLAHKNLHTLLEIASTNDSHIKRLDWFYSGECNLTCPSCTNWTLGEAFPPDSPHWKELEDEILPHLYELDLKGGEPLIQISTFKLIDLLAKHNPYCLWEITTNGQVPFDQKIQTALERIYISYFSVSIDSLIPEVFQKLRKGGELEKALSFLDSLIKYNHEARAKIPFTIIINFVLQKANYTELAALEAFCQKKKILLNIIVLDEPQNLSIYDLPSEKIVLLKEKLKLEADKNHK